MLVCPKRLFIFAAYDADGIIDETLLYYLRSLSEFGNIVFVMDSDAPANEVKKIDAVPNILYHQIARHGEYDFGSYKRGYAWALEQGILGNYDYVYLVNDSCYLTGCPARLIRKLERKQGAISGPYKKLSPLHIQSFFLRLKPIVFMSDWFQEFILNVSRQDSKLDIVKKYEIGLSTLARNHGLHLSGLISGRTLLFYEQPVTILKKYRYPLLKKQVFSIGRINWSRHAIQNIYRAIQLPQRYFIYQNAIRTKNYMSPNIERSKYCDKKTLCPFVLSIVRKSKHPQHRWLILFNSIQICKI